MKVALITEGTYPHTQGGVSVWCDQLVRGMPEHRFEVHALVSNGTESVAWELPGNVDRLVPVPLWGPLTRRRAPRAVRRTFPSVFGRFLDAIGPNGTPGGMARSLQELHGVAQQGVLPAALHDVRVLELLLGHMTAHLHAHRPIESTVPAPTVADAAMALNLLEHYLRPLASDIPRVDVCHSAANGLGPLVAMGAKWRHGTPFVLSEHGVYLRESLLAHGPDTLAHATRQIVLRFVRRVTQAGYRLADVVAPGSDYNSRWEIAEGVERARIRRIHNGIDPATFVDGVPEPAHPTIAWVGRINPLKDLKTLLRAFARVVVEIPEARLRIFGATPLGDEAYREECIALLHSLELDGRASFEGRVDDVVEAYQSGQLVMLTSISEGFPYAVIEAMACGRPAIATDVGGVAEAIADRSLLAVPRDDEALAHACITLLRDPVLRLRLAREGRHRVVEHFTLARCIDAHVALYEDALSGAVGRRPRAMSASRSHEPARWLELAS